jgi:REP element-mobilizing transposase RayT
MSSGRMHYWGDIHMVTNRCEEGRFFMKPTREVVDIIRYWFGRSMAQHGAGLEVYAFCFMSNHFHVLCRDTGGQLAKFMGYFQGNVARALNGHLGRGPAHFWQGHYHDQIVDGPRMFWQKYLYVTTNPVKSGLVNKAAEWKGFCSFKASLSGKRIYAHGVDQTRLHHASRGKKKPNPGDFVERFEFELAIPPGFEEMSQPVRAREIGRMVRKAEKFRAAQRGNRPALGMDRVLRMSSQHRPKAPPRLPHRRFACDSKQREHERLEEYRQFIAAYKNTYAQFRSASLRGFVFRGQWPRGSFPPSCDAVVVALDWAA